MTCVTTFGYGIWSRASVCVLAQRRGLGMEGPTTQLSYIDEFPADPVVQPAGRQIVTVCHNAVRYIMSGHAATIRGVACLHLAAQWLRVRKTPSLPKQ